MTSQPATTLPITRRALIRAGLGAGGAALLGGGGYAISQLLGGDVPLLASWRVTAGAGGAVRRFHSLPDLAPPTTHVLVGAPPRAAPGYLLMGPSAVDGAQSGPAIVDSVGDPVWFAPVRHGGWVTNFSVQTYRGAPVLIWWEGAVVSGYGQGEAVIVDSSYRELARVRAANGRHMDLHELLLTERGTALFTCAPVTTTTDLSAMGASAAAPVRESVFQEVDIATGRLVREWRSLGHVDPSESYRTPTGTFDYLHLNSIGVTPDGNLLVSGRHTWALYKLDRSSGDVIWRLGGKRTQFAMGTGAQFAWQHDVRQPDAHTLTVFDNGDDGRTRTHATRGLLLDIDERGRRVSLTRAYTRPHEVDATAMGSARHLSDGHMAIGWGSAPYVTEFDEHGTVLSDLRIGTSSEQKSYRSFRQPWTGRPAGAPALAASRDRSSARVTAYLSWNGATEVSHWRIDAGSRPTDLRRLGIAPRRGFETAVNLGTGEGYVAVTALDARRRPLGRSAVLAV
ncbi:MAG TPA: arylsulfotransferase family protein [Solirubrobacteraceae bacterium]